MPTTEKMSFCKVFLPAQSAYRIKIPNGYHKHMKGKKSGMVLLKGPSGHNWPVKLTNAAGNSYLVEGWREFVKDHAINAGYFLTFKFDGFKTFKVMILNTSGCEDKNALSAKPRRDSNTTSIVEEEEEEEEDDSSESDYEEEELVQKRAPNLERGQASNLRIHPNEFIVKLRAYSTREGKRGKTLVIPTWFGRIYFKKPTFIVLRWKNEEWDANVTISGNNCFIRGGWQDFVTASKVKEGDYCKFILEGNILHASLF